MIDITGIYPPAIYRTSDDKLFAVSAGNYVEIPSGTKLSDLNWIKPKLVKSSSGPTLIASFVSSRNPDITYAVQSNGQSIWCNCPGYMYRRTWRHIKSLKV